MDAEPRNQQCSTSNSKSNSSSNSNSNRESELIATSTFTRFLTHQLLISSESQSSTVQNINPLCNPYPNILFTMSGTNGGSSSTNWNDVLKHGSALGILKPDLVFPSGGGSGSGGSSGSSSGGTSGSTAYPSGSVRYSWTYISLIRC